MPSTPLRALVVHPEPAIASLVKTAASELGYAVTIVPDGERAIDRFVQEPFDVVVVEYFLPGRDGVTTVESIRWAPEGRNVRAILLAETEPELAPLAALGARIDAVETLVGTPAVPELRRALERAKTPVGQVPTSPGSRDPRAKVSFDDETVVPATAAAPSKIMATRFDDESTVQGSAGVARAMLGDLPRSAEHRIPTLLRSSPDAAPPRIDGGPSEPDEGTQVAPRDEGPARASSPDGEWRRDPATMAEARQVREEEVRAEGGGGLSLSGRFDTTPFPALLATLADARTNGGLICKQELEGSRARETTNGDAPTKIVYFRAGVPIFVRSNLLDECLGQLLLRKKRIGRATLEESIRRTLAGEGLQGEILIDMGALSPIEVSETLAAQSTEKLYDLFGWRHGTWRVSTNVEPPRDGSGGIELGLPEIVYEGVCAAMPATLLLDLLTPHLEHFVIPDAARLSRFTRVRLPAELRPILARIDGRVPLRTLLAAGSRPGAVAQMIYALECLRAVTYEERPRPRGAPREESDLSSMPGLMAATPGSGANWEEDATSRQRPRAAPSLGLEVPTARERPHPVAPPPAPVPAPAPALSAPPPDTSMRASAEPTSPPGSGVLPAERRAGERELDQRVDRLFEAERSFRRGSRALERQRWDEALSAFVRAHELVPTEGEFLAYVGWCRFTQPSTEESTIELALTELAQAAELSPSLYVTHLLHARVLARLRRDGEARRAYERVLVLEPGNEEAKLALGRR